MKRAWGDSQSRQPSEESLESLGYHCGSCVGDAIQLRCGLPVGDGRLFETSVPFSLAGDSEGPSPRGMEKA